MNWNECVKEVSPGSEELDIDDCLADPNYRVRNKRPKIKFEIFGK